MEKSKLLQNMKPKPATKVPRVSSVKSKAKTEETKQAKISVLKPTPNSNISKTISKQSQPRKTKSDLQDEENEKQIRERILKNTETLKEMLSRFMKNEEEIIALKNERKIMKSSADKLELLRGFVVSEIEYFLAQHQEEPEEDFTYEQLLELGEQIGSVSKGFTPERIALLPMDVLKGAQSCSICLSILQKGERVAILPPCAHGYHLDCITSWLKDNKTCPLCLQEVVL